MPSKSNFLNRKEVIIRMNLLPSYIKDNLPKIGATEWLDDPQVICKFFFPDFSWTWYTIEYDGQDIFYGYVAGDECELGYFSLSELVSTKGKLGLPVERDLYFKPRPLSEVRKLHE